MALRSVRSGCTDPSSALPCGTSVALAMVMEGEIEEIYTTNGIEDISILVGRRSHEGSKERVGIW